MSNEYRYSAKEKLEILKEIERTGSLVKVAKKYDTNEETIRYWRLKYEKYGIEGLEGKKTRTRYSKEIIKKAVTEYLNKEGSYKDIALKNNINSSSSVSRWVKWYHEGRSFDSIAGGENTMKKPKKTTYEQRLHMVEEYLNNGRNYKEIIEKYGVSYRQINSWVKKYEQQGKKGLEDRRGKPKRKEDLTDTEILEKKVKELEKELELKELEIIFLKKLEELEKKYPKA